MSPGGRSVGRVVGRGRGRGRAAAGGANAQAMAQRPRWPSGRAAAGCCRCCGGPGHCTAGVPHARPIHGRVPQHAPALAVSATHGEGCRTVRQGAGAQGVRGAAAAAGRWEDEDRVGTRAGNGKQWLQRWRRRQRRLDNGRREWAPGRGKGPPKVFPCPCGGCGCLAPSFTHGRCGGRMVAGAHAGGWRWTVGGCWLGRCCSGGAMSSARGWGGCGHCVGDLGQSWRRIHT